MDHRSRLALEAARRIRASTGFARLTAAEQAELEANLGRLESVLDGAGEAGYAGPERDPYRDLRAYGGNGDPYAAVQATPADLQRQLAGGGQGPAGGQPARPGTASAPAPAAPPPADAMTEVIGGRAAEALQAIDFPGFVAGLVTGTFQAIVDATTQQVREYADLVANLARSLDDFARDNVSDNQVRDHLVQKHPRDLRLLLPEPGKPGAPRLLPQPQAEGASPPWLAEHGLDGEVLTEELTEGALIQAGRRKLGEDRMQALATLVLLGINRIVVDEGHIRAKMQFHASAQDRRRVEINQLVGAEQGGGIAARQIPSQAASATMVSTVQANAQADASIRADLMGEVHIQFSTQVFPLERFADSAAIQLINRHARWQQTPEAPTPPAKPVPTPTTPSGETGGRP